MKMIRVGLTTPGTLNLERKSVTISADEPFAVTSFSQDRCPDLNTVFDFESVPVGANRQIVVSAINGKIQCAGLTAVPGLFDRWVVFFTKSASERLVLADGGQAHPYRGKLIIGANGNKVRVLLECDLDDYVKGVLGGEMPASYALEALKSQAIAARTYALNPRVDHARDYCNVCDSFLCCQCFIGMPKVRNERLSEAIASTAGQILTCNQKPILALFSACAGGHTENYDYCFSNQETNAFPDAPRSYLAGVPEGKEAAKLFAENSESAIKQLWHAADPQTDDAWSRHFRWQVSLSAQALESHMHHVIEEMMHDPKQAPFVLPPSSNIFGHIESFAVNRRGVAGTAMELAIKTSKGVWQFRKELIIRSIFKNPDASLKRLASARIFFDPHYDDNGLLTDLKIFGLGSGHGVGMQQDGAEGMARSKATCRQILSHYYTGTQIEKA